MRGRCVLLVGLLAGALAGCVGGPALEPVSAATTPLPEAAILEGLAWRELSPAPVPRAEHCGAVLDGKVYSIGGFLGPNDVDGVALTSLLGAPIALVDVYDVAADAWTRGPDYPVPVNHCAAVAVDGAVLVFSGADSRRLDVAAQRWEPLPAPPVGVTAAAADPASGLVYLAQWGADGEGSGFYRFDPRAGAYEKLADYPVPRNHASSAFVGGRFYLGNGDVRGHAANTAQTAEYDPLAGAWRLVAPNPVVRGSTAGAGWLGRFVVLGGQNQTSDGGDVLGFGEPSSTDAHAYDPATGAWTALPPMPKGRHGFFAVAWDDRLYVVGGAPQEGSSGTAAVHVLERGAG